MIKLLERIKFFTCQTRGRSNIATSCLLARFQPSWRGSCLTKAGWTRELRTTRLSRLAVVIDSRRGERAASGVVSAAARRLITLTAILVLPFLAGVAHLQQAKQAFCLTRSPSATIRHSASLRHPPPGPCRCDPRQRFTLLSTRPLDPQHDTPPPSQNTTKPRISARAQLPDDLTTDDIAPSNTP